MQYDYVTCVNRLTGLWHLENETLTLSYCKNANKLATLVNQIRQNYRDEKMIGLPAVNTFNELSEQKRKRVYLLALLLKDHPELLAGIADYSHNQILDIFRKFVHSLPNNHSSGR